MNRKSRRRNPYLKVNLGLATIILGIFVYSGVFSANRNNHPIPSFYEKATGKQSPGSGLSRSFSEIVRGRLESSRQYNPYGLRIFSFFAIQFLLRAATTYPVIKYPGQQGITACIDGFISTVLFIWCFYPFLAFWKMV